MSINNNNLNNSKIVGGDDNSVTSIKIFTDSIVENLPQLDDEYQHREEESKIIDKLNQVSIMCIYGMSGLGKTSISIAIAQIIQNQYAHVIYIDGSKLKSNNDMNNIYIDKLGYKANLETILTRKKTLVIIDNVNKNLPSIVEKLEKLKLSQSKVIITTQSINYVDKKYTYELKPLNIDISRKILLRGIEKNIDEKYITQILKKVSYNPLIIKILNRLLKDGILLEELCENDEEIMIADDIESEKNISTRIMEVFMKTCINEIRVLYWLNCIYIDKELLKYMLKSVGFKKIENRGIFDKYNSVNTNTIKVHDLILNAIKSIISLTEEENIKYRNMFVNYFISISRTGVEENRYCNALYMHKEKINEINEDNKKWGIEVYLSLKCSYDYEFNYNKWENIDYYYLNEYDYNRNIYFEYMSVIEFLERKKNYASLWNSKEERSQFIKKCIEILKGFLKNNTLSNKIKLDITHHLGKLYIANKQYNLANIQFENIIEQNSSYYAAKLQLIRLYKSDNLDKSKKYIREILDNYKKGYPIDTTIVLATYEELNKEYFCEELNKYVLEELNEFSKFILDISNFYFDLPFKVFVSLGKKFSYKYPEIYKKIAENIPIKLSDDINDDKMLFSIGEFYKDFIKSSIWNNKTDNNKEKKFLLLEAEKYYNKMSKQNDFQTTSIVGFYILASNPKEALKRSKAVKNKNEPFIYYYMSQAYEMLFKQDKQDNFIENALNNINKSIELSKSIDRFKKYISTFYRQKARILSLINAEKCRTYYLKAIKSTNVEKFKDQLKMELKNFEQNF